jgi:hypothetical protein
MLTIEGDAGTGVRLPLTVRFGVAILVFGILEDLVAHRLAGTAATEGRHAEAELIGHAIVFVGMVLILLGVVIDGVRQAVARRTSARHSSKGVA